MFRRLSYGQGDVTKFPLTWPLATRTITIWSTDCDLCLNSARSKVMVFSSQQLSRVYGLRTCSVEVSVLRVRNISTEGKIEEL